MTDHHEEFAAGKIEEQLDTLLQADDAMSSSLPQPGKRLVQDLRLLTTYNADQQADQVSIDRVQQRLQQRLFETQQQPSSNRHNPSLQNINSIGIKKYQKRQSVMKNISLQRDRNPWVAALVAVLIVGLFIGVLVTILNAYPRSTPAHPGVTPISTPNQGQSTPKNQVHPTSTPARGTPTPVSENLPPVQTDCPARGTARAAIMPAMPTASPRGILYLASTPNSPSAQINHYNVTTGTTTTIFATAANSVFPPTDGILLSTNKQWLMFTIKQNNLTIFQLMRADGKELQTLYCATDTHPNPIAWSPNQRYLILSTDELDGVAAHLTLIDLTNGSIKEILDAPATIADIQVVGWVGSTGIYVSYTGAGENTCSAHSLYLLSDITKDSSQQESNLQAIPLPTDTGSSGSQCQEFSVSPHSSQLLLDNYIGRPDASSPLPTGPSTLSLRPIAGGNAQIINDAPTHNIISAGFITNSKIWFMIRNPATSNSQNGLWMMNTDGSGLVRLLSEPSATDEIFYNDNYLSFAQDTQNFAIRSDNNQQETLIFGSTNGGNTTTFATATGQEGLTIIGWT